ncbi:MAG: hypothetical protein O7H41_11500 [Planctomycetota bacterium]|nr:hypothetical protein [Planctomycetota bacterium]
MRFSMRLVVLAILALLSLQVIVPILQPRPQADPGLPDFTEPVAFEGGPDRDLRWHSWKGGESHAHPLLRDGVEIVIWWLDGISHSPQVRIVRERNRSYSIKDAADLKPFIREITSGEDALAFTKLLRYFLDSSRTHMRDMGRPLLPQQDPGLTGKKGALGYYTPEDADRWEVPFETKVVEEGPYFRVERIVLLPQTRTWGGEEVEPYRVVLMMERVWRDGGFFNSILRVLEPDGSGYKPIM